jgi:hypothetical protein
MKALISYSPIAAPAVTIRVVIPMLVFASLLPTAFP